MSPSSGLPGRTGSALELQGEDLGSVQEGLAGAGHSGQGGFAGWHQVLAVLTGLGLLRVR